MSSYHAYQTAVNENRSKAEIDAALKAYNAAKANYTNSLGNKTSSNNAFVPNVSLNVNSNNNQNVLHGL